MAVSEGAMSCPANRYRSETSACRVAQGFLSFMHAITGVLHISKSYAKKTVLFI